MKLSQVELTNASSTYLKKPSKPTNPLDKAKVTAAIAEYDRVHASVERDLSELKSAATKYSSAGYYRQYYRGTYQRIGNILSRMQTKITAFLKVHGEYLPKSLKDHLNEDLQSISGITVPPLY